MLSISIERMPTFSSIDSHKIIARAHYGRLLVACVSSYPSEFICGSPLCIAFLLLGCYSELKGVQRPLTALA